MAGAVADARERDRKARVADGALIRLVYETAGKPVLTYRQRDCVVQYVCEVCDDYRLSTQTAWTAMSYFDRYLGSRGPAPIERNEAELISLTCILLAAKLLERQSPGISDLCAVAANAHPRADFPAAELLILETLSWRLHVVAPHSILASLLRTVDAGRQTPADVKKHVDFFVDLASFELLGFEHTGATIAGACVFCAMWNMGEEKLDAPSPRLQQIVAQCGAENATAADVVTSPRRFPPARACQGKPRRC